MKIKSLFALIGISEMLSPRPKKPARPLQSSLPTFDMRIADDPPESPTTMAYTRWARRQPRKFAAMANDPPGTKQV